MIDFFLVESTMNLNNPFIVMFSVVVKKIHLKNKPVATCFMFREINFTFSYTVEFVQGHSKSSLPNSVHRSILFTDTIFI